MAPQFSLSGVWRLSKKRKGRLAVAKFMTTSKAKIVSKDSYKAVHD